MDETAQQQNRNGQRSDSGQNSQQRQAPPPRPPILYTQSGNMKGYDDELMPPRPVHKPVDNSIEFPGTARQNASSGAQSRQRTNSNNTANRTAQQQRSGTRPRAGQSGRNTKNTRNTQNTKRAQSQSAAPRKKPRTAARKKRKITKAMLRRRRLYRRLTAALLLVCVIAAGGYLTVTMLFKISSIQVQTTDGTAVTEVGVYSSDEILSVLGLQLEENIFSFSAAEKEAELEKQLPLLEEIKVKRSYPGTVIVRATPAVPVYATQTSAGWLTLSGSLKIIMVSDEQPALPVLWGGEPAVLEPGEQLSYMAAQTDSEDGNSAAAEEEATDTQLAVLETMLDSLQKKDLLSGLTRLEYADNEEIAFLYQDRISVRLGTLNELEYKMDYAAYLIFNVEGKGFADTDTGQLDCSHLSTDGTIQAIFAQGEPEMPSGYRVSDAAAQPAEEAQEAEAAAEGEEAPAQDTEGSETPEEAGDEANTEQSEQQ